ncbi:MAG: aldehyde:ferredoxin oxidoreductase [Eubacteriales bacterium]|nr:aldehyde:ferredoxin oxidoreductase [Eubacteriales bacterium]
MFHEDKRVLFIDLNTEKLRIEKRPDLNEYLGGIGIAIKLFEENVHPQLPPLHESQPVVFAVGAITSIFPVMTKTVAVFRSPHTGELGESYAGGRLAFAMMDAGYDAIVLTGKSKKPTYISVRSDNVSFRDARALWGLPSTVIGRIIREREPGPGKRSIIRIGPAGENGVSYSSVCVDTYRHFGRLGLGAVLGSKNIKAMQVYGTTSIPIKDFPSYWKAYREIYKKCTDTELMQKYHDLGTSINIEPLNALGVLPTKNLKQAVFEHGDKISGEQFAECNLVRKMACVGCPVGCIHIGQFRREFDKAGHEYESISVSYDYELIFALGSYLGIKTTDEILELIDEVEELGMDAMSAGVVLGWATEALQKGLISEKETVIPLKFGDKENYIKALRYIAYQENDFYIALGKGAAHAASIYGGKDFAMQIAGNEMAGYHTGYGALIGMSCGARHSHLCNGGYSIDQGMKTLDIDLLVGKLFQEEIDRCMLNSLVMCLFARKVYDRETILMALNSVGYTFSSDDLTRVAEKIYATKIRVKRAMGFEQEKVEFPKRFFETPSLHGLLDETTAYEAQRKFNAMTNALMKKYDGPEDSGSKKDSAEEPAS